MSDRVLDASVVLAVLNREPGADESLFDSSSAISAVNLSEVVARMTDFGWVEEEIRRRIAELGLDVVEFDRTQAYEAGLLRPATRAHSLSLADRACLSLAIRLDLPAYTADRAWAGVSVSADVRLIR